MINPDTQPTTFTLDELGRQYSAAVLHRELHRREKVVYSLNGNRATRARAFLKKIEKVCSRVGIRRVADLSFLGGSPYPVFQSCRPNLLLHSEYGQTSSSQGKGTTRAQAKISCIMEAIEGYCAEPRNADLVRASYDFLSGQHVVLDPRNIVRQDDTEAPSRDEPIMWTRAHSLRLGEPVWVPAQLVYFPFVNQPFQTRSIFVSGSNGLASGSTYLEAAIHGLYELIERYYIHKLEIGQLRLEAIFEDQIDEPSVQAYLRELGDDAEVQLYSLELAGVRNLPMIMCVVVVDDMVHQGWGCCASLDMAISRAFSEAMQSHATQVSGAREDMRPTAPGHREPARDVFGETAQPDERTLTLETLRARIHDRDFAALDEEYAFIVSWLTALGFDNIFFANLTRHGIDVPVVKAFIPELEMPHHFKARGTARARVQSVLERQFRNI